MARIRTVKPEFWGHPIMSRLTDAARLAAIALLNFADDEGYFFAEPAIVRSWVWPFDESSATARKALEELQSAGWIEIRNCESHGPVGRVNNFARHQRIDRPKKSQIRVHFGDQKDHENQSRENQNLTGRQIVDESTINRRFVDDHSTSARTTPKQADFDSDQELRSSDFEQLQPSYEKSQNGVNPEERNGATSCAGNGCMIRRSIDDSSTISRRSIDERSTEEGKGREGKGSIQEGVKEFASQTSSTPSAGDFVDQVVLEFPVRGNKRWQLRKSKVAEWVDAYPGIGEARMFDELRKALQWVVDNQPKTASGMTRFLNSWLSRTAEQIERDARAGKTSGAFTPRAITAEDWEAIGKP